MVQTSNVFSTVPEDSNAEVDEDTRALLTADFEIGHYIRESIVPRATLYFTGISVERNYFVSMLIV